MRMPGVLGSTTAAKISQRAKQPASLSQRCDNADRTNMRVDHGCRSPTALFPSPPTATVPFSITAAATCTIDCQGRVATMHVQHCCGNR